MSSRWESYNDVVDENKSGIGYEFNNKRALRETLLYCINNVEKLNDMKKYCLLKSEEFTIEQAMEVLFSKLT